MDLRNNPFEPPWSAQMDNESAIKLGQELFPWSLPDFLIKLAVNEPVTEFDRQAPTLVRNLPYILEKIDSLETLAARNFKIWVEETFSLEKDDYKILL